MSMQVPAFLAALATGRNLALEGQQGLGGGNPVPFLSIKSQQFAAVDIQGGRIAVGKIDPKKLTASLTGTVETTYNGTTVATLAPANYARSGVIGADSVVHPSNAYEEPFHASSSAVTSPTNFLTT